MKSQRNRQADSNLDNYKPLVTLIDLQQSGQESWSLYAGQPHIKRNRVSISEKCII